MIKRLDNQAQKLNDQINQYPQTSLIVTLGQKASQLLHIVDDHSVCFDPDQHSFVITFSS